MRPTTPLGDHNEIRVADAGKHEVGSHEW